MHTAQLVLKHSEVNYRCTVCHLYACAFSHIRKDSLFKYVVIGWIKDSLHLLQHSWFPTLASGEVCDYIRDLFQSPFFWDKPHLIDRLAACVFLKKIFSF